MTGTSGPAELYALPGAALRAGPVEAIPPAAAPADDGGAARLITLAGDLTEALGREGWR